MKKGATVAFSAWIPSTPDCVGHIVKGLGTIVAVNASPFAGIEIPQWYTVRCGGKDYLINEFEVTKVIGAES